MTQRQSGKLALLFLLLWLGSLVASASASAHSTGAGKQTESTQPQPDDRQKIVADQMRLAEQYRLLEEKLFALYQYERDQNPDRSELLQRAYQQSQSRSTAGQLDAIVRLLRQSKLRNAEQNQQAALNDLKQLLSLLQSEDRNQRVRDDIQRHQKYLEEVNRMLRIQQGIRGQTENGNSSQRINNSQQKNADRAAKLAEDIGEQEPTPDADSRPPGQDTPPRDTPKPPPGEQQPSEQKPSEQQPSEQQPSEQQPSEPKPGEAPSGNQPPPADDAPPQNQPGQNQPGQNQPGQSTPGGPTPPPSGDNPPPPNPVQQRLQQAEQKMRQAHEKLEQARTEQSVEDMRQAERELAEAKRELEEILRQLREEEIQRMLASLESRFRKMLELQIKIYERTIELGKVAVDRRRSDFEIQTGKLAVDENALATEASRALLLLQDDGSSIAIPETVRQMHLDMQQTAARLTAGKVDEITQEIEADIIETLEYLVDAFADAQEKNQDESTPPPPGQPSPQPGEQPLVDQLAELKLIRGLQQRIHRRHQRYSKLLDRPDDPIGQTQDPDIRQALERLGERQDKLHQITRDIVIGKNK